MWIKIAPNLTISNDKNGDTTITQTTSENGKNTIILKKENINQLVDVLSNLVGRTT